MPDPTQLAQQGFGQVAQTDLSGTMQHGIALAQAHQAHLLNVERVKQDREKLQLQKSEWLQGKVLQGAAIVNDSARKKYFKGLEVQARAAEIPVDPASWDIISSKDGAKALQDIQIASAGLPDNQRTRMALDFQTAMQGPKAVQDFIGHAQEQASQRMQQQGALQAKSREMDMQRSKAFEDAKEKATSQNKENSERIHYANQILGVVKDPELRKDPAHGAAVISGFAKTLFPGGVIRESEIQFLDHIAVGMGDRVKNWVAGKTGSTPISQDMFYSIGQLAQHIGLEAQHEVDKQKTSSQKYLPQGVNADDVYSTIPKADTTDIRTSFPDMFPADKLGKGTAVPSAKHAEMTPQGPPPAAAMPVAKINQLNAYQKQYGLSREQIAQGKGLPPVPGAPNPMPNPSPQIAEQVPPADETGGP